MNRIRLSNCYVDLNWFSCLSLFLTLPRHQNPRRNQWDLFPVLSLLLYIARVPEENSQPSPCISHTDLKNWKPVTVLLKHSSAIPLKDPPESFSRPAQFSDNNGPTKALQSWLKYRFAVERPEVGRHGTFSLPTSVGLVEGRRPVLLGLRVRLFTFQQVPSWVSSSPGLGPFQAQDFVIWDRDSWA